MALTIATCAAWKALGTMAAETSLRTIDLFVATSEYSFAVAVVADAVAESKPSVYQRARTIGYILSRVL